MIEPTVPWEENIIAILQIFRVDSRVRGFISKAVVQLPCSTGMTATSLQKAMKVLSEEAEKASYSLWLWRKDNAWGQTPLSGQLALKGSWETSPNMPLYSNSHQEMVAFSWWPCSWLNRHLRRCNWPEDRSRKQHLLVQWPFCHVQTKWELPDGWALTGPLMGTELHFGSDTSKVGVG